MSSVAFSKNSQLIEALDLAGYHPRKSPVVVSKFVYSPPKTVQSSAIFQIFGSIKDCFYEIGRKIQKEGSLKFLAGVFVGGAIVYYSAPRPPLAHTNSLPQADRGADSYRELFQALKNNSERQRADQLQIEHLQNSLIEMTDQKPYRSSCGDLLRTLRDQMNFQDVLSIQGSESQFINQSLEESQSANQSLVIYGKEFRQETYVPLSFMTQVLTEYQKEFESLTERKNVAIETLIGQVKKSLDFVKITQAEIETSQTNAIVAQALVEVTQKGWLKAQRALENCVGNLNTNNYIFGGMFGVLGAAFAIVIRAAIKRECQRNLGL
ncbi:MAG: hypothetical protein V4487_03855 [Chlamydiota bacterium]